MASAACNIGSSLRFPAREPGRRFFCGSSTSSLCFWSYRAQCAIFASTGCARGPPASLPRWNFVVRASVAEESDDISGTPGGKGRWNCFGEKLQFFALLIDCLRFF